MPKEVVLDFAKIPRRHWLDSTLSYQEARFIEGFDDTLIEERRRIQEESHENRKDGTVWTQTEWLSVVETYMAAGYTRKEAIWMADEGISPSSEQGMDLIDKRSTRVKVYMDYADMTRVKAIEACAKELRLHNRRKGNIDEYMFSESTII